MFNKPFKQEGYAVYDNNTRVSFIYDDINETQKDLNKILDNWKNKK